MTRERIARALLHTYPAGTRSSLGAEMVGTVLDSSDASLGMFARECIALLVTGARARAGASASERVSGQLVDGCVIASQVWLGVLLSHGTAQFLSDPGQGLRGGLLFVLALWPILALSLIGARRTAGTAATTWFVCLILLVGHQRPNLVLSMLIPFSGCLAMAIGQPNRRRELRGLLWLAPVVVLSLLPLGGGQLLLDRIEIEALILASALAVALFPVNPRLLVACAVVWTTIGLMFSTLYHGPPSVLLLALSAPLVLLATTGRVVLARRRRARP